jgi:AcrR family transcriptional regulator
VATTKERFVETTADLFRRQGYVGTGVKQIVEEAGSPFGSLYHFFPGGKEELGAETIRWSGGVYGRLIDLFYEPVTVDGPYDVVAATRAFFDAAAETVRESGYADACPIATVALEVSSVSEPLREACADVFNGWIDALADRFRTAGIPADRARELATTVLALLEGAFVLCRATRTTEALELAGATAADAVAAALR